MSFINFSVTAVGGVSMSPATIPTTSIYNSPVHTQYTSSEAVTITQVPVTMQDMRNYLINRGVGSTSPTTTVAQYTVPLDSTLTAIDDQPESTESTPESLDSG